MKKIIFLDIDGVLATPECFKNDGSNEWGLVERIQNIFGRIIDETGAEIVLTSSWRFSTLEKTKQYMKSEGFLFNDKLIGVTIRAYQWLERGTGIHLSIPRGVEIKQWIDTHIHSDNGKNWEYKKVGKDFNYVILDDSSDMLLQHKDNFVHTTSNIGLTEEDAELAINILNRKID